jgi:pimeloyl-ACP methyl ester carboxylesterase
MIAAYTSNRVDRRGINFHYLKWGDPSSPPMVLLHGGRGNAHQWDFMAPSLAERYRVFAPDQRGHGDTGHADSYSTQEFVADLEALRQHWNIERFVLMGQSLGGHNAMAYASTHPHRVSHLIIVDIAPDLIRARMPDQRAKAAQLAEQGHQRFATFDDAIAASVADARTRNSSASDENLRYRAMCDLRELSDGGVIFKWDPRLPASSTQLEDLWPVVGSLTMPSLLVRAGLTEILPQPVAERMVEEFPNLYLVEVPDSGHGIPTDRPETLCEIVVEWLGRTGV